MRFDEKETSGRWPRLHRAASRTLRDYLSLNVQALGLIAGYCSCQKDSQSTGKKIGAQFCIKQREAKQLQEWLEAQDMKTSTSSRKAVGSNH